MYLSQDKYDEFSKIGIKVYHLQQLSESGRSESELSMDSRFVKLKSQIFSSEDMKKLSPAQTVAACVALGKLGPTSKREWTVICNALKAHCEAKTNSMSPSQAAVCLYWIAKSGNSVCVKDRIIETSFKRLLRSSNDWSPVDMGWLLFFMRIKGAREELPIWRRMMGQIAYRFNERLVHMSAKNVAAILSEFGGMRLLPGKAIHRAASLVDSQKHKMDSKSICIYIKALSDLKVYRGDALYSLADFLVSSGMIRSRMDMRQVASTMHSFAKLDFAHKPLIQACLLRLKSCDPAKLTDADLAMISYALGRWGVVSCDTEWRILSDQLRSRLRDISPLNMAVIITAISKAGFTPQSDILDQVAAFVQSDPSGFTEQQLLNITSGLSTSGRTVTPLKALSDTSPTAVNRFQLNMLDPSPQRPVMEPKLRTGFHSRLEDYLKRRGAVDISMCPQIGAVWVDASLKHDGQDYAILSLRDSDVCKLDPQRLLGPARWRVSHIESSGYKVVTITLKDLQDDASARLGFLGEVPSSPLRRVSKPFHYDLEAQKVSFR